MRPAGGEWGPGTVQGESGDVETEDRAAAQPGRLPALQPAVPDGDPDPGRGARLPGLVRRLQAHVRARQGGTARARDPARHGDRKSRRLNSSHMSISYAVFCLKKKKKKRK